MPPAAAYLSFSRFTKKGRATGPSFFILLVVLFGSLVQGVGQVAEIKLQLGAAVGAHHLAVLQNGFVEIDFLFTLGAGGHEALFILVLIVPLFLVLVLVVNIAHALCLGS